MKFLKRNMKAQSGKVHMSGAKHTGVIKMTDTKTVRDALEKKRKDANQIIVNHKDMNIRADYWEGVNNALSDAIAALEHIEAGAGDELRIAWEFVKAHGLTIAEGIDAEVWENICKIYEHAATAPKHTEEQWLNLFRTVADGTWTPEQAVEHMKDDVSVCVATAPKNVEGME